MTNILRYITLWVPTVRNSIFDLVQQKDIFNKSRKIAENSEGALRYGLLTRIGYL